MALTLDATSAVKPKSCKTFGLTSSSGTLQSLQFFLALILLTSFKGITHEHDLGDAFKEALPFTALLVVFFGVVSVIADQQLFTPIITYVLAQEVSNQAPIFFVAKISLFMLIKLGNSNWPETILNFPEPVMDRKRGVG